MPHAVILLNARARRAPSARVLEQATLDLRPLGWECAIETPEGADAMRDRAAEAARAGADALVAVGGDGALNAVIGGALAVGASVPPAIALVPAGTGNVWAREAHLPRRVDRALALVATGRRVTMDVGTVAFGGRAHHFLLMCGMGIDAAVVREVERAAARKRLLGRLAFAVPALRCTWNLAPTGTMVAVDGEETEHALLFALAANTRLYGGVVRLAGDARADDGRLDLLTFDGRGPLAAARHAARSWRGWRLGETPPGIAYGRGVTLTLTPTTRLPVQADGEYLGAVEPGECATLSTRPGAVRMVVGPGPLPFLGG